MSLGRYLNDVGSQEQREERAPVADSSQRLDALIVAHEGWGKEVLRDFVDFEGEWYNPPYHVRHYNRALSATAGLASTAGEIMGFVSRLCDYAHDVILRDTGLFLAAAINSGSDSRYDVFTECLPRMDYLGYRNSKHLVIHGDVGMFLPERLSGELHLNGNYTTIASFTPDGGTLYLHGKLICKDGVRV